MDLIHSAFVSSTFTDLIEARRVVVDVLLRMRCFPAGMEFFTATAKPPWNVIQRTIDLSDYYVLIIANRYGSLLPEGISYTVKEYRYAKQQGVPVLAFLHKSPESLPNNRSELDPESRAKLVQFRSEVESEHHIARWTDANNLGMLVATALAGIKRDIPRSGWVRASVHRTDDEPSPAPSALSFSPEFDDMMFAMHELPAGSVGVATEYSEHLEAIERRLLILARKDIEQRLPNDELPSHEDMSQMDLVQLAQLASDDRITTYSIASSSFRHRSPTPAAATWHRVKFAKFFAKYRACVDALFAEKGV